MSAKPSGDVVGQRETNVARKIAVVGAGITGLGAAYLLSERDDVTLFEAATRLGGHARTVEAGRSAKVPVDTGFIVFNDRNYPLLNALFKDLNIPTIESDMSFAITLDDGAFEYGTQTFPALFADLRNLVRPRYWEMLKDILKFNAGAVSTVANDPAMSLEDLLDTMDMGRWFRERYLLPISGAIWSTSTTDMLSFPASSFTQFFDNHGLLTVNDHPQWSTVVGGSRTYVKSVAEEIVRRGGIIRTGTPVQFIVRKDNRVTISAQGSEPEEFDAVVIATHSDQALNLLGDASPEEQKCLSALRYKSNRAYLHDCQHYMPRRKGCWSSWVFQGQTSETSPDIALTYWMNQLQNIPDSIPLFVTLNPASPIPGEHVFDEHEFHHPQFDAAALAAQGQLEGVNGRRNTWFCGAYARNGFHEDGLWSAVRVARGVGARIPWD